MDSSYRAEAGGPHAAAGLVEDRLDALLTGSAGPVMWDALSSKLAAAVTKEMITEHHSRSNPEWAETNLHIAHDISRHMRTYRDLLQACGAARSLATQRAGIRPDTLHVITARHPRIDIDVLDDEPAIRSRAI